MFNCASCGDQHTDGAFCSACKKHFDFPCSGVTESGYRKLGDRKNAWRCLKCKTNQFPSPSPASTSAQSDPLDKMNKQLNKIMSQLAPLASLVEDVKLIKCDLGDLKESLGMAHDLITNFTDKIKIIEDKVEEMKKSADEIPALRAEVTRLSQELQDRDQWARANNVEIRGVPLKKNENLFDIVEKIGHLCNFYYRKEAINYIARIPTRLTNTEKPILVAFNRRYLKEEFVSMARNCKELSLSNLGFTTSGKIYVNDHLMPFNKTLLSKAKALAKEKNFRYIWEKHCKIMARKSDTSPIFQIKTEKDLLKI
ncbi:hypothetical protein ABMA28_006031 [Loxostege sticticalis]|uniref:FP protein C-terminal domain-containing protein n=1 Tax=Loxostege sticticalis TaxID=481309 RepID=A0ABD0SKJ7_LOXSC